MTNQERFENLMEMAKHRDGWKDLMNYIRKSDFYKAPASTRFHLSCEAGLLQHSLNVYDALIGRLVDVTETDEMAYQVAGKTVASFKKETLALVALLHDLCKTNFYTIEYRNQKTYDKEKIAKASSYSVKKDNGGHFIWEQVPVYAIDDKNPYGHGEKSVMMIEEFMKLTMEERYAIRWHMGMSEENNANRMAFNASCEKYPLVLLLHNADMEASHFMEDLKENKEDFIRCGEPDAEVFQEALPV